MTSSLFSAAPIELEATGSTPAPLPLEQRSCASLSAGIVAMEPWSVMNYPADKPRGVPGRRPDAGAARYAGRGRRQESGVVSVRHPWLKGPYLELLALLPDAQNQGIGSSIMAVESAGLKHGARNLWVCASSFNARALRFTSGTALPARRRCRASSPTAMTKFCCANFRLGRNRKPRAYSALSSGGGASGSMSGMSLTSASGE